MNSHSTVLCASHCSEAIRVFRTCIRLGAKGPDIDSDDCHFGAAICASQNAQHMLAASLFQAAARCRNSPRHTLSMMGAFLSRAKALGWDYRRGGKTYEHERQRLIQTLQHVYLREFDRGAIPAWALVQPHELLVSLISVHPNVSSYRHRDIDQWGKQ